MGRRTAQLAGVALALVIVGGCESKDPDQLVVTVTDGTGGRLVIPGDLDAFELRVWTVQPGSNLVRYNRVVPLGRSDMRSGGVSLPQSLTIVRANEDSTGTVRVEVLGLRGGAVLQRIERTAAFGIGRRELPPFALTPLCFGVRCPPLQSCQPDGTCATDPVFCLVIECDAGVVVERDAGPCGPGLLSCGGGCVPSDEMNCGGCGVTCPAGRRCLGLGCACREGQVDCGGTCVDLTSDLANCGSCGNACSLAHATAACTASACVIQSCASGFGDCDGMPSNGCERALDTLEDCGSCGRRCAPAHAVPSCGGGSCSVDDCNSGWDNCNGSDDDGCEAALDSLGNCGGCGRRCAPAHAVPSCGGGSCSVDDCDSGWDNCNGNDADGCEASLSSTSNCGSCGRSCARYEDCVSGSCACANFPHVGLRGGVCLPSCGGLSGELRIPGTCCGSGCVGAALGGGFGTSYDCNWCCDGACL